MKTMYFNIIYFYLSCFNSNLIFVIIPTITLPKIHIMWNTEHS